MRHFRKDRKDSINRYLTALSIYRLKSLNGENFVLSDISKELSISHTIFSCAEELGILKSTRRTKEWLSGIPDIEMAEKVNNLVRERADKAVAKSRNKSNKDKTDSSLLKPLPQREIFEVISAIKSDQTVNFEMISECCKSIIRLEKELDMRNPHLIAVLEKALDISSRNNEIYKSFMSLLQATGYIDHKYSFEHTSARNNKAVEGS